VRTYKCKFIGILLTVLYLDIMKRFENKVVFITGGSKGIGAAIVKRFALEGASVVFTYGSSADEANSVVAEIIAAGGQGQAVVADSGDPTVLTEAIRNVIAEKGKIDILVNNAGMIYKKAFELYTLEEYDHIMAVNVRAAYIAAQAVLEQMPAGGRIITIGSNMADNAIGPFTTLYTMSKAALQGFNRGLARDLGPKGITVNLVQPGPIDTGMNPANTELADFLRSRMALAEYGDVDDVAGLVAFLASDEGKYITGTSITIDGGLNA
jgi:3-oxoacyl-[acyl-carrier protein] reductase